VIVHRRREDHLDLLCDAGEHGWELVTIAPNNVAYLKREVPLGPVNQETDQQQEKNYPAGGKTKTPQPSNECDLVGARSDGNLAQEQAERR
jgi:hypothetical protein